MCFQVGRSCLWQSGEHVFGGDHQRGALIGSKIPNDLFVDSKILMDEQMPQTNNPGPFDVGAKSTRFLRNAANGLADVLEVSHGGVKEDLILGEILKGLSVDKAFDLSTRVDDIQQEEPVSTQP